MTATIAPPTCGRCAKTTHLITGDGFVVELGDGSAVGARRLLVATGLVDELPEVAGVAELWGSDVLHCPYCHGWEARDKAVGVLATSPLGMHGALLWRQLTADVTVFLADPATLRAMITGEYRGRHGSHDA